MLSPKPKSGAEKAGVVEKNQDSVETPKTPTDEELRVVAALEQQGFKPAMARRLVARYGVEACTYQMQRFRGTKRGSLAHRLAGRGAQGDDRDDVAAVAAVAPVAPQTTA